MRTQEEYDQIFGACLKDFGFPEAEIQLAQITMLNMHMVGMNCKSWPAALRRMANVIEEFHRRCPECP